MIICGNSLVVLKSYPDNFFDACVTDPPYALVTIQKRMSSPTAAPVQFGKDGLYQRAARGFMGQDWDNGDVAFSVEFWLEVLRVLKPGAHLLAFGGSRTYHRLACAIEDAGFEIRDQIQWIYGSGFPKNHNQGDGWGTALKPAHEPIVMARKPFYGSVAANMARWGVGAINIDGCRIPIDAEADRSQLRTMDRGARQIDNGWSMGATPKATVLRQEGRWPANLIHDGSPGVVTAFPTAPGQQGDLRASNKSRPGHGVLGPMAGPSGAVARTDKNGSAARFFYCAKATAADREEGLAHLPKATAGMVSNNSGQHITRRDAGYQLPQRANTHPTVKPTPLMRYLCRLVTPVGGTVLDPFAGSGSTGKAAILEGMQFLGIEQSSNYVEIAQDRLIAAWLEVL